VTILLFEPEHDAGELDEAHEGFSELVVSVGDTATLLDSAEEACVRRRDVCIAASRCRSSVAGVRCELSTWTIQRGLYGLIHAVPFRITQRRQEGDVRMPRTLYKRDFDMGD
jgi:hypothetical protein